jgi:hypothetical protein
MARDWSDLENTATIADYFSMLEMELRGLPYNKSEHRRALSKLLDNRSDRSIESKRQNISAVLLQMGMPWINGFKPLINYQQSLRQSVEKSLNSNQRLIALAAEDVVSPIPELPLRSILNSLIAAPPSVIKDRTGKTSWFRPTGPINFLEREARFRLLGLAGERFVIDYERARLNSLGKEHLASRIEHVSEAGRDYEGFDIRSFEDSGKDRLIEVKTTRYAPETPFFLSRNEVGVSEARRDCFHLYRVFNFKKTPQFFILKGSLRVTCLLEPTTYAATVA